MLSPKNAFRIELLSVLQLSCLPLLLICALWFVCVQISLLGFPFPNVELSKFSELAFFCISLFSFIVFLTITPFQTASDKLSPFFYSRFYHTPFAHFGIYLLLLNAVISFVVVAVGFNWYLSQLYIAMITSIIFSILIHRFWVLRCLYQPYIVDKYIETLEWDESAEAVWLELFECTMKAIKQNRIGDAKNFMVMMGNVYERCSNQEKAITLKEDLLSLHFMTRECRPLSRFVEARWPFCVKNK